MRRFDVLRGADRPVRGDPFAGGVGKQGGEMDLAGDLLDPSGLDRGDLLLAERLADDVQTGRQRGIPEGSDRFPAGMATGSRRSGSFRGSRVQPGPGRGRPRWSRSAHWIGASEPSVTWASKLIAPDLERLALMPCPAASFASCGMSFLSSVLAVSCSPWASRVRR